MKIFCSWATKRALFDRTWIRSFGAWFGAVFSFFFVLFFVNQLLFLGNRLLELDFGLVPSLLFILWSLPSVLDWAFPLSLALAVFWWLTTLVARGELLGWLTSGVSFSHIARIVLMLCGVTSLTFFILNDLAEGQAHREQQAILHDWQQKVPISWIQEGSAMTLGGLVLAAFIGRESPWVVLLQRVPQRQRDYLLIRGSLGNSEVQGLTLHEVHFFSPSQSVGDPYYRGRAEEVTLNPVGMTGDLTNFSKGEPLSFLPLTRELWRRWGKDSFAVRQLKLVWHQKLVTLVGSWLLASAALLLVAVRAREGQRTYPYWFGIVGAGGYLVLMVVSRLLMIGLWQRESFWVLWLPPLGVSLGLFALLYLLSRGCRVADR